VGNHSSLQSSRQIMQSLKARADKQRTRAERLADRMTGLFGSMGFLLINALWFAVWIVINTGLMPGVQAFDPFPFSLLTTIVSLEAIFLAIIVLISQNRASQVADLREEVDLQVDILTEREITKLLHVMLTLAEKQGIRIDEDTELKEMLEPTNLGTIEKTLQNEVMKH
jgi:uncharacterized membrane protein